MTQTPLSESLLRRIPPEQVRARRACPVDQSTLAEAARILADIDAEGDPAAIRHAVRLGDMRPGDRLVYTRDDLAAARHALDPDAAALLERAAARVDAFARAQRACATDLRIPVPATPLSPAIGEAGHVWTPVEAAGCYAPAGRFPLVSSVLMTVIPARAAGVNTVWLATPRATTQMLAAAAIAGADAVLALGGVQAIAALASGLCGAPACDAIVGPGNRWVTAAKFLVSARVGIDSLAGASELVVIADDSADPALVAADLLAQAEHDPDAAAILITTSERLADRAEDQLRRQLDGLPTAPTARAALAAHGVCIVAPSLHDAVDVSDRLGPEHLHLAVREPAAAHALVRNAGAVFIGERAAEVLADYAIGPNHVLPTGGASRYRAGLSVFTFLRPRTWLEISPHAPAALALTDAAALARMEGLEAHARSALRRIEAPC